MLAQSLEIDSWRQVTCPSTMSYYRVESPGQGLDAIAESGWDAIPATADEAM